MQIAQLRQVYMLIRRARSQSVHILIPAKHFLTSPPTRPLQAQVILRAPLTRKQTMQAVHHYTLFVRIELSRV